MRPTINRFLALYVCLTLALLLPASAAWGDNPGSTKARPALYEFGAGYCVSCKEMAKIIGELQTTHGDQVEFRLIYADKEKDLFQQYKIIMIPTQVFLNAEGKEVDRHMGALTKEEVLKKLKDLKLID